MLRVGFGYALLDLDWIGNVWVGLEMLVKCLGWFGNACIIFGKFRTGWLCLERFGRGLGSVTHWRE
jgi:hypothetical protein